MSPVHDAAREGFGSAADRYERARPGYPAEAVAWLVDRLAIRPAATVLDLAAGTGKLTRLLPATGARVVAVEPVAAMRETLERLGLAGVEVVDGTAEALPLADGSVDAVTVAQAFHWFRPGPALAEIQRVLRAGGALGLVWNRRLLDDPLQAALDELIRPHRRDEPTHEADAWRRAFEETTLFEPLETASFPSLQRLDRDGVVDRVLSTSFIAALPDDGRTQVERAVRALAEARPEPIELPYRTDVYAARRRGSGVGPELPAGRASR